jgi:Family of unknown function (DUF5681)
MTSNNPENNSDDAVGYRKPPKHTQYKPNQSGNISGLPKDRGDFDAALKKELSKELKIGDAAKVMTARRYLANSMVQDAINGDMSAAEFVIAIDKNPSIVEQFEEMDFELFWENEMKKLHERLHELEAMPKEDNAGSAG